MKWLLTHDSHKLKKGDVYEGETLPLWLVGKAVEVEEKAFEVATPKGNTDGETGETKKGKKDK